MEKSKVLKIDSLTSLRGYLASWVVLFHFWSDFRVFFPQLDFLTPIAWSGFMAVPVFFMLSGFVLALNYGRFFSEVSLKKSYYFLLMRLSRVYPVHVVTLLIVLVFVVVARSTGIPPSSETGYSVHDFILNLLLVHAWVPVYELNWNYPSWSISSEWFAYILFPFMVTFIFSNLKTTRSCLVVGVLSLVAGILWVEFKHHVYFYELIYVIPFFVVGACIYYLFQIMSSQELQPVWTQSFHQGTPSFIILLVVFGSCYLPGPIRIPIVFTGFALLIMLLVFTEASSVAFWKGAVPVYIGDVSYSLYMSHALAQKVVYKLLPSQSVSEAHFLVRSGFALTYLVSIVVACLVIYYTVEKPCLNYFRRKIPKL